MRAILKILDDKERLWQVGAPPPSFSGMTEEERSMLVVREIVFFTEDQAYTILLLPNPGTPIEQQGAAFDVELRSDVVQMSIGLIPLQEALDEIAARREEAEGEDDEDAEGEGGEAETDNHSNLGENVQPDRGADGAAPPLHPG